MIFRTLVLVSALISSGFSISNVKYHVKNFVCEDFLEIENSSTLLSELLQAELVKQGFLDVKDELLPTQITSEVQLHYSGMIQNEGSLEESKFFGSNLKNQAVLEHDLVGSCTGSNKLILSTFSNNQITKEDTVYDVNTTNLESSIEELAFRASGQKMEKLGIKRLRSSVRKTGYGLWGGYNYSNFSFENSLNIKDSSLYLLSPSSFKDRHINMHSPSIGAWLHSKKVDLSFSGVIPASGSTYGAMDLSLTYYPAWRLGYNLGLNWTDGFVRNNITSNSWSSKGFVTGISLRGIAWKVSYDLGLSFADITDENEIFIFEYSPTYLHQKIGFWNEFTDGVALRLFYEYMAYSDQYKINMNGYTLMSNELDVSIHNFGINFEKHMAW